MLGDRNGINVGWHGGITFKWLCTQSGEPKALLTFHNHLHQNSAASTLSLQACGRVPTYVFHNAYLI